MDLNFRISVISLNNILLYKIVINLLLNNSFQSRIAIHSQFSNILPFRNVIHLQHSIFSLQPNSNLDVLNISKIKLSPAFTNNSLKDYKAVLVKDNWKALHHQPHVISGIPDPAQEMEMNIYTQIFNRLLKMKPLKIRIINLKTRTLNHQMLNHLYVQNLKIS